MTSLVRKGLSILVHRGPIDLFESTRQYLGRNLSKISDNYYYIGYVLAPIVGLLYGVLTIRKKTHYTRFTLRKNIFGKRSYHFPTFEYYDQIGKERKKNLEDRYFAHEEVKVNPGDTVFEVGAFVGVTTVMAARVADHVIAIEASPRNYNCAKKNLSANNINLLNIAAWNEYDGMEINYGTEANDDSLIEPDHGFASESQYVKCDTVEHIVSDIGIEKIDFLKVEAEGAEPEVVEGIRNLKIDEIVVSCTEERHGRSPVNNVSNILHDRGYTIVEFNDKGFLFARKED